MTPGAASETGRCGPALPCGHSVFGKAFAHMRRLPGRRRQGTGRSFRVASMPSATGAFAAYSDLQFYFNIKTLFGKYTRKLLILFILDYVATR